MNKLAKRFWQQWNLVAIGQAQEPKPLKVAKILAGFLAHGNMIGSYARKIEV